jgi:hypothetical protein
MKCRLCGQEKELQLSHIIPEFCFGPLYDEKHRYIALMSDNIANPTKSQKGKRERLLCKECEGRFSKYERYASQILHHSKELVCTKHDKEGSEFIIEYAPFKLFQMSLLWRLGVSSTFSTDCVLGKHERKLRAMLNADDPGDSQEYGCILVHSTRDANIMKETIMPMRKYTFGGIEFYGLVLEFMYWFFRLSNKKTDESWSDFYLQKSGSLRIFREHTGLGGFWQNQIGSWSKIQKPKLNL